MSNPALDPFSVGLIDEITEEEIHKGLEEYSDYIAEKGAFAQGDTLFTVGHYTEDKDVWFEILTVTTDDIMRECGIPEEQREQQRLLNRSYAKHFLRFYDGPESTVPLLEG